MRTSAYERASLQPCSRIGKTACARTCSWHKRAGRAARENAHRGGARSRGARKSSAIMQMFAPGKYCSRYLATSSYVAKT
eukprot:4595554-Pleurochrysis_carterae.AAC.3